MIIGVLLAIPPTRADTIDYLLQNWGNIASAWGLIVSLIVLFFAKNARAAAEEAKLAARTRGALEDLQVALICSSLVGQHARERNWTVVQLKAEEVMGCCRTTVNRWGDDVALKGSRNRLNQAAEQMRSIAEEASKPEANLETIVRAQLEAHEKLSAVVGKILREQEVGS